MSNFNQNTQIGDLVEISDRDKNIIGVYEIFNLYLEDGNAVIYLTSNDRSIDKINRIVLEIFPDGSIGFASGPLNLLDLQEDDVTIKFIGPGEFDMELLQGLRCTELSYFQQKIRNVLNLDILSDSEDAIKRLTDFWFGDSIYLDLIKLNCNLEIPRYFSHLRIRHRLGRLALDKNNLESIPSSVEIGNLYNLRTLLLGDNKLSSLPKELGNLRQLEGLGLSNNEFNVFPSLIKDFPNLRLLDLSSNKLTFVPEWIGDLYKLEYLYLSNNELLELPPTIGSLVNLNVLEIQGNRLTFLPEEIGYLIQLIFLKAQENQLTFLPEEIGNLENLQILKLDNNKLLYLTGQIGNLHRLHTLDLRHNKLKSVPLEIGNLKILKYLYLDGNRLDDDTPKTIPQFRDEWDRHLASIRRFKPAGRG